MLNGQTPAPAENTGADGTEPAAPPRRPLCNTAPGVVPLDEPAIYAACLASYNSGRPHGRWIDATQGADHIRDEINAMLAASPIPDAEEWAFHDHSGFEGAAISEYADIDHVADLAEVIAEQGALGAAVYTHFGSDLKDAIWTFRGILPLL